jgi:hypothetical protein
MTCIVNIPVSIGELYDKISILQIKSTKIIEQQKLIHVNNELNFLMSNLKKLDFISDDFLDKIKDVNNKLWDIEDKIRLKEKEKIFDNEFIELARLVYITNDRRCEIKNEINKLYNSAIFEVKSYEKY